MTYLLATPARPDDADNTVRVAFGNEGSPQVVEAAAERFGMRIIDVFGSTEGAIALDRTGNRPSSSIGRLRQGIMVVDEEGTRRRERSSTSDGRLVNADRCVGEIVNTLGVGPFEGYYRNEEAMRATTRNGWYWSGDLGYVDDDGWVFFAGRTSDWLRVDGENFPAAPIEAIVGRHPDVLLASVYGVPDADSGDQVMVALVLRDGADFDAAGLRRAGSTGRPTSARSGSRDSSGSARRSRALRPTRSSPARSCTRSSARTVSTATPCSGGSGTTPRSMRSPRTTRPPCAPHSRRTDGCLPGTCSRLIRRPAGVPGFHVPGAGNDP